jgi:transcriptional regulator NrdR
VKCPFCSFSDDKVIDSREGRVGDLIRRRRECLKCGRRFTTYERIDEIPYMVIKKDGRRERFDRQKILQGLLKSCEKRPVPTAKLEALVDDQRDRRTPDESNQETRQSRLCPLRFGLSGLQGRQGIHVRAEKSAEGPHEEIIFADRCFPA